MRATFRIEDDLIVDHVDRFSFWKWSRQALGTKGLLLGWTPFLRCKVGGTARAGLDKFIAKERKRAAAAPIVVIAVALAAGSLRPSPASGRRSRG